MQVQFPASPARLGELRRAVRADLRGVVPDADLDDLVVALNEAATNAVLHGSADGHPVEVAVRVRGGWAEMTVLDRGPAPPSRETDLEREAAGEPEGCESRSEVAPIGGRGLWLMGRLVDEVRLERVQLGTRITLRRRLGGRR